MKLLKKIEKFSKSNPNKVAICLSSKISYSNFWQSAINIASYLNKKKFNRICVLQGKNDDIFSYIIMIATLICGKTYIPINNNTPINRVKLIINSSKSEILFSQQKISAKFDCKLFLHKDLTKLKKIKKFQIKNSSQDAYIIYTSGSTGIPKGVRISRKSLDHYILWISNSFFKNKKIRCSQHPGIGFDLSVADIFGTLCNGGELYPIQNSYDKLFLGKFIKENNISHWVSVPSAIDLIFSDSKLQKQDFKSLKKMFFCGEILKKMHLEKIFKSNSNVKVINSYGPTEATVSCTSLSLNNKNYKKFCRPSVSFGKPIKNMKIGFLNRKKKQGELFISGPQVSRGYTENNILNTKKFIKINKVKTFITGDICKLINGNYYFLNRIDRQVKILGNRIELDEIDRLIEDLKNITSHSIIHKNKIYTFFNSNSLRGKLNLNLKEYLPKYMLPSKIIRIKKWPKNINQKVDEKKLINLI
tara:strand:+ start:2608 stop:4029 length:1422 start_codon:yes stop_codon:yes gene_type:complete